MIYAIQHLPPVERGSGALLYTTTEERAKAETRAYVVLGGRSRTKPLHTDCSDYHFPVNGKGRRMAS